MTRRELWNKMYETAATAYDPREARAFTAFVCEGCFGMRFTDVIVEPDAPMPNLEELPRIIAEIQACRPAQYITGYAFFLDRKFRVREGVLIPRPETEELVRCILSRHGGGQQRLRILDVGTGSGCIAVSLAAELPQADVTAIDLSEEALCIARENGRFCGDRVRFTACDILREEPSGMFDVIVSNPPYVTRSEVELMQPNVLRYEPDLALFVDDNDPLLFYRVIGERGCRLLRQGGSLWFEINERFGEQTVELLRNLGYCNVNLLTDLFGKARIIEAWRK